MSEGTKENAKPFDPFEPLREMRDAYLDSMAKVMVDAVNTEAYAQTSGAMLEKSLTISAPFREAMEKSMLQVLQQLSMPSRQDFTALADRIGVRAHARADRPTLARPARQHRDPEIGDAGANRGEHPAVRLRAERRADERDRGARRR